MWKDVVELELHDGHGGCIGICGGFHSLKDVVEDVVELESHVGHGGWIGVCGGFNSLKDVVDGRYQTGAACWPWWMDLSLSWISCPEGRCGRTLAIWSHLLATVD